MGRNGVADTTSSSNIGEEYHTSERMVNVVFVYVLNCHGEPFMPCRPRKARLLLKEGKAKVVKMVPFTIRLRYGSSGYTQEVSLRVDAGTHHIGVSATTGKQVLFEAEAQPRTGIQELLAPDDAVLAVGEPRDDRVGASRPKFGPYFGRYLGLDGAHAASLPFAA